MSRVDFAHGAAHRLHMACRTVARHVQAGHRVNVYCTDPGRLQRFDSLLWSFEPASFIPHVTAGDPMAAHAGVILYPDAASLAGSDPDAWLLNLDMECPPDALRFARILEIVSRHEADILAARARWLQYSSNGHDVRAHQLKQQETFRTARGLKT